MITDMEARKLASEWHGGQWTGLYALSSSGAIIVDGCFGGNPETHIDENGDRVYDSDPGIIAGIDALCEIERAQERTTESGFLSELQSLHEYIEFHGPRNTQEGWSRLSW